MKYKPCPNCGKKGFYEATANSTIFIGGKTHKCKYCEMEFKLTVNKGEKVWLGDIPTFV